MPCVTRDSLHSESPAAQRAAPGSTMPVWLTLLSITAAPSIVHIVVLANPGSLTTPDHSQAPPAFLAYPATHEHARLVPWSSHAMCAPVQSVSRRHSQMPVAVHGSAASGVGGMTWPHATRNISDHA